MKTLARTAALATAACAALVLAGCTSTASGDASAASSTSTASDSASATTTRSPGSSSTTSSRTTAAPTTAAVDVFSLSVGDCMADDIISGGGNVEGDQNTVSCASPHQSEAYATKDISASTFPGSSEVSDTADEFCASEFQRFVGLDYQDSVLNFSMLTPTASSWAAGDREILCLVSDPAGDTTGTLRGANR